MHREADGPARQGPPATALGCSLPAALETASSTPLCINRTRNPAGGTSRRGAALRAQQAESGAEQEQQQVAALMAGGALTISGDVTRRQRQIRLARRDR